MSTFEEIGLNPEIVDAVKSLGFKEPTPIQAETIPHLLTTDKDLIASAQTGTGKTAAFGLPAIQMTDLKNRNTQTLILCPTRELCVQIAKDIKDYAKYAKGLGVVAVYGGANIVPQMRALSRDAQIVVATPGRAKDLIERKKLVLKYVARVVLDEADEMLSMGFKEDLDAILATTPDKKQTLMFSATMSKEIIKITEKHMPGAKKISVAGQNVGAENVTHLYYTVSAKDRYELLKRLADITPDIYALVFCRTRRETKEIANKLIQDGYNADALHGDLSQGQRDEAMGRFRSRQLQILVATDVAARGLDVNDITHVINVGLPDEPEIYVHRSGRTGRAGRSGTSIAIITSRDGRKIREAEKKGGFTFAQAPVPSGEDICQTQLFKLIEKIKKVEVNDEQIEPFLKTIYGQLEGLDREQLIKHFVSAEFNRFLSYYKNARDLTTSGNRRDDDRGRRDKRGRDDRPTNRRDDRKDNRRDDRRDDRKERAEKKNRVNRKGEPLTRLYINVGSKNKLNATRLIGLINEGLDSGSAEVGKIEIMKKFSFFEIEEKAGEKLIQSLQGQAHDGVALEVEVSEERPQGGPNKSESFRRDKRKGDKKGDKKRDFRSRDRNERDSGGRKGRRKKY